MRWLISDIFKKFRNINLLLAIKFENINSLKLENNCIYISFYKHLFNLNDINEIEKIFKESFKVKNIIFLQDKEKLTYPYPVVNSKFNNFITRIAINNKIIIEFFQKDNRRYYEKLTYNYSSIDNFLEFLQKFTLNKIELLEKLYRYNQIVLPFKHFNTRINYIVSNWNDFLLKNNIVKFVDTIYFSF